MSLFTSIFSRVRSHPFIIIAFLTIVAGGGYYAYATYATTSNETRYVLGTVTKGTIVSSISASGQVASTNETDIKAKVGGEIVSVAVKTGQRVAQGQVIASIDSTNARSAVTDAALAVEEARLNLEESTLKAPIDYKALQEDVARAKRDLDDSYDDAYVALAEAFVKIPDIVTGADAILYDTDISVGTQNIDAYANLFISAANDDQTTVKSFAAKAETDYLLARDAYTKSAATFKNLSRTSSPEEIKSALAEARTMATLLAKAAGSETNLIDTVIDILERRNWTIASAIPSAQTKARGFVTTSNSVVSSLTAAVKAIDTARDSLTDAEHALELGSIGSGNGSDSFDVKFLQNTLKQKEAALVDAQQTLANHTIRAPFGGIVATLDILRGDTVANGGSVGTLISDQKIAELSLNEVDVAKIEIGDKATLTFDALEALTLTGSVAEINAVGTVSQGVVSYTLKIGFDTQDSRIKSGMTANASIITDVVQDVLVLPLSAVKTQNDSSTVQVFSPELTADNTPQGVNTIQTPQSIPVAIGLSSDTSVEIRSGLSEGAQVVVRTIKPSTTQATTNTRGATGGPPIRF